MFIMLMCWMPGTQMVDLSFWDLFSFDAVAHMVIFGVLICSLIIGFVKQYSFPELRYHPYRWSLILGIAYGGCVELIQDFASERHASLVDFGANVMGCLAGLLVFILIYRRVDRFSIDTNQYY